MIWKGKNVLIVGGYGFIGSNLAQRLLSLGAQVSVSDNFFEGGGANRFNLNGIEKNLRFFGDAASDPQLMASLTEFEVIFDMGAQTGHQASMQHPLRDLELNSVLHLKLLETCRSQNHKPIFIFASTRQLYGRPKYLPVDEKHPIAPVDINGIHKLTAEHYFKLYADVYGIPSLSLRLTNTYGPRQLIRNTTQGFVGWFMNRAIQNETLELFGGGDQVRDFNEVEDVLDALLISADFAKSHAGQIFNLSGERASLATVAEEIVRATSQGRIEKKPFPEHLKKIDIGNYYGTSEAFETLTGWKPKVSLRSGVERMSKYYLEHGAHYLGAFSK